MSTEPPHVLAQLREVYRHWSAGDWTPAFGFYAREMEWGWSAEFPDIAGVYADTETPNSRLQTWLEPWESWYCSAEDYVQVGEDTIVVLTRYQGRGKASGMWIDTEGAHVWKFRDGEAVRLEVFADRARALCEAYAASCAGSVAGLASVISERTTLRT